MRRKCRPLIVIFVAIASIIATILLGRPIVLPVVRPALLAAVPGGLRTGLWLRSGVLVSARLPAVPPGTRRLQRRDLPRPAQHLRVGAWAAAVRHGAGGRPLASGSSPLDCREGFLRGGSPEPGIRRQRRPVGLGRRHHSSAQPRPAGY